MATQAPNRGVSGIHTIDRDAARAGVVETEEQP